MSTEKQLPDGWVETTLDAVMTPERVLEHPEENSTLLFIGLEHVESETMRLIGTIPAQELKSSALHFWPGDVLYGRLRPYLNKVLQPDFEGLCSSEFLIFRKSVNLSSSYLQYFLNSWNFKEFASHQITGDRPRVDWEHLKVFEFSLPPLLEQHRIVSAIEQQFTRLDSAVASLKSAQARIKQYRASLLKSAVEGEMTKAWRAEHPADETGEQLLKRILIERRKRWEEEQLAKMRAKGITPKDATWKLKYNEPQGPDVENLPELPKGWCWANLGQIASFQNGRPFPSKEYTSAGVKLLRPGNLYADGLVQWTDANTRYLPEIWTERNQDWIVFGYELIMNLTAQSLKDEFLGRVCITKENERCLLNQRLARITPFSEISRYYILYILKSSIFRRFVDSLNTGSLIQHIFTSQLDNFSFPLPPLTEQTQIVAEVEAHLSKTAQTEISIEHSLKRSENERQSILHEAFLGHLVLQDPDDEPASILLERIREERKKREEVKKTSKESRKGGLMGSVKKRQVSKSNTGQQEVDLYKILVAAGQPLPPDELFKQADLQHEEQSESVEIFYKTLHIDVEERLIRVLRSDDTPVLLEALEPLVEAEIYIADSEAPVQLQETEPEATNTQMSKAEPDKKTQSQGTLWDL